MYQDWNLQAKTSLKGLYSIINIILCDIVRMWAKCGLGGEIKNPNSMINSG